jgi:hypothetical protein
LPSLETHVAIRTLGAVLDLKRSACEDILLPKVKMAECEEVGCSSEEKSEDEGSEDIGEDDEDAGGTVNRDHDDEINGVGERAEDA